MHSEYNFKWKAGDGCDHWFDFWHGGSRGQFRITRHLPDRQRINPSCDYEAEIVPQLNSIHAFSHEKLALTAEFVQAFNVWDMGEHLEQVAYIKERPERYGTWEEIEHVCKPPVPVRGIVWEDGAYRVV